MEITFLGCYEKKKSSFALMKENTAQAKALDSPFIQDISAHEHIQVWFTASYIGLAVFQLGGLCLLTLHRGDVQCWRRSPHISHSSLPVHKQLCSHAGYTWKPNINLSG